jgi:cytidine deaminase
MAEQHFYFAYEVYESEFDLAADDALLLQEARKATANAYAPYSNFLVGCAAKLANSQVITGSNQENASFPAGICAERVLLGAAASLYPRIAIHTLAVTYNNVHGAGNFPASPCGICRQSLLEHEDQTKHAIRIVLAGLTGPVYIIPKAALLLPLAFNSSHLDKLEP